MKNTNAFKNDDDYRLHRINKIIRRIDDLEEKNISDFQKENPFAVLMGTYALAFLPKNRLDLRSRLAEQAHQLQMKCRYLNRGITHIDNIKYYNQLICAAARKTKKTRKELRQLPLKELKEMMS